MDPKTPLKNYVAPNGLSILGTLEILTGRAEIIGISADGEPEYEGDTEIFWDEQRTKTRRGKLLFLDEEGNEWTFDQLTPGEDVELDAFSKEVAHA